MPVFASLALALALVPAPSPLPDDGGIAWKCEREWKGDGVAVSVVRYLTESGRQTETYGEWKVDGTSGLVLDGFTFAEGGDAPSRDWFAHIGWSPKIYDPWRFLPQIVLGPWREGSKPPHADRPGQTVPDRNLKWSEMRRFARRGRLEASLVDQAGRTHRSGAIDLRRVRMAEQLMRAGIALTRADAREFRNRCERFTVPEVVPAAPTG